MKKNLIDKRSIEKSLIVERLTDKRLIKKA